MELFLKDESSTYKLGRSIAKIVEKMGFCPFLFQGELGTGKTTLIKAIVKNLKGGEKAEVSSPSFNIFNIYPTVPETIHIDLYRCSDDIEEEIFEYLYSDEFFVLLEWPDHLPKELWPEEYLLFLLKFDHEGRRVSFVWKGEKAKRLCREIFSSYPF